jgi:predicted phosphodiesterase
MSRFSLIEARHKALIVSGYSHIPRVDWMDGILYLNPGSAGRRRFNLPITFAILEVTSRGLQPEIHDLGAVLRKPVKPLA